MSFISSVFIPTKVFDLANTLEPFSYDEFVGRRRHNKYVVTYRNVPVLLCTAEEGWLVNDEAKTYGMLKATPVEPGILHLLWTQHNVNIQQAKKIFVMRALEGEWM
jgi:hypothetical protein